MQILIPASIPKDRITVVGGFKGCVNSKLTPLPSTTYAAGMIAFEGFMGTLDMKTGLYEGSYSFTDEVKADAPTADLNALFATKAAPIKKVRSSDGDNIK